MSEAKKKDTFSDSLGFILAAIAAAVGLSNIWRFSAEAAQNGGGIYVLCYLICIVLVGYPLVLAELALGRSKQKGVYECYQNQGSWEWVGLAGITICFLIFCFYNVVAGWVLGYLWNLLTGRLFVSTEKEHFVEFYSAIRSNWQGNLIWTFIMMVSAIFINQAGVSGGIEQCAKILMPIFIVMMVGLIGYSITLEGAGRGLYFYLWPSLSNFSLQGFAFALSQSFMSLSIGMGALVTYGSFVNKKDNLYFSSFAIVAGDTLVAVLAGFFLFAFLGHEQVDFDAMHDGDNALIGPGLAFITLPLIFSKLGYFVGPILAGSFFLLLIFAAITSSISLLAAPAKYMESKYKMGNKKALWILGLGSFAISIVCILSDSDIESLFSVMPHPEYNFHDFFMDFVIRILTPLATFFFSLFIAMKWKMSSLFKEAEQGGKLNKRLIPYIEVTIRYITPLFVGISFLTSLWQLTYDLCG